ncbi:hypothetical protein MKW92_035239 [Papaver armeniacum]|nr:hypothetical protein MKW92_035239 [Papaver armeniacum]
MSFNQPAVQIFLLCHVVFIFTQFPVLIRCCHDNERTSLLSFKSSLSDPSGRLSSWKGKDCCTWNGVHCSNDSFHVIKVDLRNLKPSKFTRNVYSEVIQTSSDSSGALNGTISPALFNLFHLNYLDLSNNNFDYSKIHNNFSNLKSLEYLNLSNSMFSGSITYQFANLYSLQYLDISCSITIFDFSSFSLSISTYKQPYKASYNYSTSYLSTSHVSSTNISWLRGLTNLKVLNLTGVDPSASSTALIKNWAEPISNLVNLRELSLSDCNISGPIPVHVLRKLSRLSLLRMDSNPLNSQIPVHLANFTSLSVLDLNNCQLKGLVPYLPQLVYLDVSINSELIVDLAHMFVHQWPNLQVLSITTTNVTGSIPESISNAPALIYLFASHCSIQGSLPASISKLSRLQNIDLSFNNITGHIPSSVSNLKSLYTLSLVENNMHGPIPKSLCQISSLKYLVLRSNKLSGSIPSCIAWLQELQIFDVVGNNLDGNVSFRYLFQQSNPTGISLSANLLEVEMDVDYSLTSKFQRLETLALQRCNLKGYIPLSICNMTQLLMLDMSFNNLIGSIPLCIFKLPYLSYLDLSRNKLVGTLPRSLYLTLLYPLSLMNLASNRLQGLLPLPPRNVGVFDLSENNFTGEITNDIVKRLLSAVYVSLSNNKLSGPIPSTICSKGNRLGVLDLSKNKLYGTIPSTLKYCDSLVSLNLGANNLTGNIPNDLDRAKNLKFLQLYENNLDGTFPSFIQQLENLEVISLWSNNLEGGIPAFVGSLSNLKIISLRSNTFNGSIPKEITSLRTLQFLDLSKNNLSGPIPEKIGKLEMLTSISRTSMLVGDLVSLVYSTVELQIQWKKGTAQLGMVHTYNTGIDLSRNFLKGNIPKDICQLKGLKMLNLSHNHLHGEIPMNVGNMTGLESLDLSFNNLSGLIPVSIASIDPLSTLDLSYNNLSGMIPREDHLDTLSTDGSAYIGNTLLCGYPTTKRCEQVDLSISLSNEEDTNVTWEFYGVVAIGYGTGFVSLFLVLILKKEKWWFPYWRLVDSVALRIAGCVLKY